MRDLASCTGGGQDARGATLASTCQLPERHEAETDSISALASVAGWRSFRSARVRDHRAAFQSSEDPATLPDFRHMELKQSALSIATPVECAPVTPDPDRVIRQCGTTAP